MDAVNRQVLAIDRRETTLDELRAAISTLPEVEFIGADSIASAIQALERCQPSLLITDSQLSDGHALQIVDELEHLGLSIPVFIRADESERFPEATPKHTRITVIDRSGSYSDLRARVATQLDELSPPRRHRDPFGIVDYLQLAAFSRRTLEVSVKRRGQPCGWIRVVEGEVWSAGYDDDRGIAAIAGLVASAFDQVEVKELSEAPGERELEVSINGLLLEFARLEDEALREARAQLEGGPGPGPDEFDDWLEIPSATPTRAPSEAAAQGRAAAEAPDHAILRGLLDALARGGAGLDALTELAKLEPGRAGARMWMRALAQAPAELAVDPRVHLLGFSDARGARLVEGLEKLGVEALTVRDDELLDRGDRPALLVVHLGLPDQLDDLEAQTLARFDPIWALRAGPRACPWIAVTDRPTRFGRSLCGALGASSWIVEDPFEPDDEQLALELSELELAPETPVRALGPLDVALMLVDLEVDACVELHGERGAGCFDVRGGQLLAAALEREGERVEGIQAAAELCSWASATIQVSPPRNDPSRNLPRGLPLALAALASTLSSPSNTPPRAVNEHELSMANINEMCATIVDDIQDALACGVIDLDTGMLMGIHHTISYFTQSYLDAVAAAAIDMFRGKNVRRVERLMSKHRGQEITDAFEEVFISSKAVFHFMKLIPEKGAVVVLVTRKTTNQGMGWASLRIAVGDLAEVLP